jgi:hypothetical protein
LSLEGRSKRNRKARHAEVGIVNEGEAIRDPKTQSFEKQETALQEIENQPEEDTVGEPGIAESFIPIWGSGRKAVHHLQKGNWSYGVFFAALAVLDVFLVKRIASAGLKLLANGSARPVMIR